MTVALGTTLINLAITTLIRKGSIGWQRVEVGRVNGSDIFIGAAVTRHDETAPDIDLCAINEAIMGFVIGLDTSQHTLPENGSFYNDYDVPFTDNYYVFVGIPQQGGVYLVLSETNTTLAVGDKLRNKDGVFYEITSTNHTYQMICEQAITGASNTRKYFYARWVLA